jgi:hypothetical protein
VYGRPLPFTVSLLAEYLTLRYIFSEESRTSERRDAAMLRKIQLTAAGVAATLSAFALFDLVMERLGKLSADVIFDASALLTNMPFIPSVHGNFTLFLAAGLTLAPCGALVSVRRSQRLSIIGDYGRLDLWRRLTWGASIIETAGCLLFIFSGTLLFLPGAVALLLVGVAELATILHEVDARITAAAPADHSTHA